MSLKKFSLRRGPGALTAAFALMALIATSFTDPAQAREGRYGQGPAAMFDRVDANGDGRVTRDELDAARSDRFERMDANGDGLLTEAELRAFGEERAERRAARMLDRMDEDGDGAVSSAEFAALSERRAERMFERADVNGDGAIDRDEAEAMRGRFGRGHHRPDDARAE